MHTIPIFIDSIKKNKNFSMARCTYFTIECDVPSPDWALGLGGQQIPFYLIGLSGIIYQPIGDKRLFGTPFLIEELFDAVERNPSLYIDTNEIWLPNVIFKSMGDPIGISKNLEGVYPYFFKRGSVFRISSELFIAAHSFTLGQISEEKFLAICRELGKHIEYSGTESESFSGWQKMQINMAKEKYPKNKESALKWKQGEGLNHER